MSNPTPASLPTLSLELTAVLPQSRDTRLQVNSLVTHRPTPSNARATTLTSDPDRMPSPTVKTTSQTREENKRTVRHVPRGPEESNTNDWNDLKDQPTIDPTINQLTSPAGRNEPSNVKTGKNSLVGSSLAQSLVNGLRTRTVRISLAGPTLTTALNRR
jgi:hypothetical protein